MRLLSYSKGGPHWHADATNVVRLLERLRLSWLLDHLPSKLIWALYVLLNGFITIAVLAFVAALADSPFVFPSLGPTAFLFFFNPLADSSSPRNTLCGHAIGLACGYAAYAVTGMHGFPQSFHGHLYWPRILSAALSLSTTGALMVLLRVNHPPAGATTMIVSLGILSRPWYLLVVEVAVILLTLQAFAINRLAGLPYPLWQATKERI
jgi:CBS domain-containing membrane protein